MLSKKLFEKLLYTLGRFCNSTGHDLDVNVYYFTNTFINNREKHVKQLLQITFTLFRQ